MIAKARHWWQETRESFWFVPAVIVALAVLLAVALITLDASVELHVDKRWPLVFGAGAGGSRGLLTAVAGSMITVAGVVFSITIVALSLTSSQYTSRVLRNFMSDRMNQVVLGVFVGIFAYCLVVLRTIREGDEGAFVPSFAVLGGLALPFVGIAFLIYFIHHIAISIQASNIIAAVATETFAAIERLFPDGLGDEDEHSDDIPPAARRQDAWQAVGARSTGYIESIDGDALLAVAERRQAIVRMERGIGEFVAEGVPLVSVFGSDVDHDMATELNRVYVVGRQRTVQQDAGFGVRQIVDVALKALSPGVNDTTTAVMCVDYLGAILARTAARRIASRQRMVEGELRVIARGPTFDSLLAEAFDQIRQNADGNVAVLSRQLEALATIASQTKSSRRKQALRQHAEWIMAVAERSIVSAHDCEGVRAASVRLFERLARPDCPRSSAER